MSEMIWTVVEFRFPASWNLTDYDDGAPALPAVIAEAIEGGYWDDISHDPKHNVWTISGDQNYGLAAIDELLELLRRHRVPYVAHDETKYEFGGETQIYDGNKEGNVDQFANVGNDSGIVMTGGQFEAIRAQFDLEGAIPLIHELENFFRRDRDITNLPIDHLPERAPLTQDELEDYSWPGVLA